MFEPAPERLRLLNVFAPAFLALAMASCQIGQLNMPGFGQSGNTPAAPKAPAVLPQANGEIIGNGAVRVALLAPMSAPGNAGMVGKELRNAARMAMQDFGQNTIQLVVKDTAGRPADAQTKASEAIQEGASAVLGPLFSASVSAASAITLPANRPLIAFSSDPRRARRGVYLMSFSPKADIGRTINFAISRGSTSFVALLPNGAYGDLAETTMRETLQKGGARLLGIQRYDHTSASILSAAGAIATAAKEAAAIYIPDGGSVPSSMVAALKRSGVDTNGKMLLGSGQWETAKLSGGNLNGAYFAGRDKRQFSAFANRYSAAYGKAPASTAGLAYDAVSMAAGLVRRHGKRAFEATKIESRNGYSGVNGIFRFKPDGSAERGLVVYQVQAGAARIASPAPSTFAPGS